MALEEPFLTLAWLQGVAWFSPEGGHPACSRGRQGGPGRRPWLHAQPSLPGLGSAGKKLNEV